MQHPLHWIRSEQAWLLACFEATALLRIDKPGVCPGMDCAQPPCFWPALAPEGLSRLLPTDTGEDDVAVGVEWSAAQALLDELLALPTVRGTYASRCAVELGMAVADLGIATPLGIAVRDGALEGVVREHALSMAGRGETVRIARIVTAQWVMSAGTVGFSTERLVDRVDDLDRRVAEIAIFPRSFGLRAAERARLVETAKSAVNGDWPATRTGRPNTKASARHCANARRMEQELASFINPQQVITDDREGDV
jgi:hypothetical protein